MRPEKFASSALVPLFHRRKIVRMDEMKAALGSSVDMTVFRKLRELDYCTSYSHRGKFYTLSELADFDSRSLWTYHGVHFSSVGSLVDTVEHFVTSSGSGYLAAELSAELEVEVKDPLLKLVSLGRMAREPFSGIYLYCSPDPGQRKHQLFQRRLPSEMAPADALRDPAEVLSDEAKAAIILFFSTLDERQRRLYAGLESLRLGRGGDRRLAELTGLDVHTIARGRRELLAQDLDLEGEGIRRPGGGRPPVEKKRRRSSRRSRT
jgi:hypothetical protein